MDIRDKDKHYFELYSKLSKEIEKGNQINYIKNRRGGYSILISKERTK
jgi:hypothetical protein